VNSGGGEDGKKSEHKHSLSGGSESPKNNVGFGPRETLKG